MPWYKYQEFKEEHSNEIYENVKSGKFVISISFASKCATAV
jgi:hypothetical protein